MGWRFFFYANEGDEPIHIHCQKAEKECKYWLDTDNFDVHEAYGYNVNNKDNDRSKRLSLSLNILSILKKNGINFRRNDNNEKIS